MSTVELREAVLLLAEKTGWSLSDLKSIEEEELLDWLEASQRILVKRENN